MNDGPLFRRYAQQLRQEISANTYPVGSILPSITKLGLSSGLSRNTIVAALRLLLEKGVITREGATRHGYRVVKSAGTSLQSGSDSLALVLPFNYWNYVGAQLVQAIETTLARHSFNLILKNHQNSHELESQILESLLEQCPHTIAGVILVTTDSFTNPNKKIIKEIARRIPLIQVDRFIHGIDASYVGLNNRQVGCDAANYLIDRGHRQLGYVAGFGRISPLIDRLEGFREAAVRRSVEIRTQDIIVKPSEFESIRSLDEMAAKLTPLVDVSLEGPTAYFCGDDKSAMELHQVLQKKQIRVPDDISIIGCDDDEFVHSAADVAFSSFHHPFPVMAEETLRLFHLERENHRRPHVHLEVSAEFIDRSSITAK